MSGRRRIAEPRGQTPPGSALLQFPAAVAFASAALIRLAVGATLWSLPLVRTPKLDAAEYVSWAQRLAAGDWAWPAIAQHGPGYPTFLAVLLVLGSGSLKSALVLQALLCSGTASMITIVARRWYGARAGLLAGLAYALYGPAVYVDTAVLSEGLLLFLLTAALWALAREPITALWASAGGVAFGAAALVHPTAVVVAGACTLWLAVRTGLDTRRSFTLPLALALACVVVMAPALARSWSTSGALSLQGYGGLNVYIGDSPLHDGRATFRLGAGWDRLNSEAPRAGITDPVAQDRFYLEKTVREIAQHPGAFVRLLGAKTLWLVQAEESRDSHSYYFFTGESRLLRLLPRFALLFPLAVVGVLVVARRRDGVVAAARRNQESREGLGLLPFYALGAAASVIVLVVGFRYRMPLVPALAILAGVGADAITAAVESRRSHELLPYAAVAVAAVALSHVLTDPRNSNVAEEWALTGSSFITEHQLGDAEAAYRHALELDPESGLAWDGLGLTLYDAGRLADAKPALDRALAIDADNSRAIFHLALLNERNGHVEQAVDGYARALALSPFDTDVATHLGDARRKLAVALATAGRTREARDQMRQVVEFMPSNGEAWLDLCLLSLDLGDREAAAAALLRARAHGAAPDRLAFAANALQRQR